MKAQKYFGVLVILALLFALVPAMSVSAAAPEKVAVCHLDDMGVYHLINISEMAFPAHVEHGDASPLEWVPGMEGYKFNADCSLNAIPEKYLVETVYVLASNASKTGPVVVSSAALDSGVAYELKASGTYVFGNWPGAGIADARCSLRPPGSINPLSVPAWVDGANLGTTWVNYLQVWVNGAAVQWGTGCDTINNTYTHLINGSGSPLNFTIVDSSYGDNSGSIKVEIFKFNW